MLKIKHKHHLDFPHLTFPLTHGMQFSPVMADDDDLIQDIHQAIAQKDDNWELDERPDTNQLEQFWSRVEEDVLHDPEWVHFAQDS